MKPAIMEAESSCAVTAAYLIQAVIMYIRFFQRFFIWFSLVRSQS